MRRTKGYSLLELLAVIAIVSLLAAMIFPAFLATRQKARTSNCAAVQKQIAVGFVQYLSDYDGTCPPIFQRIDTIDGTPDKDVTWLELLNPYTKNTQMRCPEVVLYGDLAHCTDSTKIAGYAMNIHLSHMASIKDKKPVGKIEAQIPFPPLTVVVFDVRAGVVASAYPDIYPWRVVGGWTNKKQSIYVPTYLNDIKKQSGGAERHRGGANYAFADGHVKWLKPEQLSASPNNDGVHPGFGL